MRNTELVMMLYVKADQRVLRHLIASYLPDVDTALKQHDIGMVWYGSSSLVSYSYIDDVTSMS